MAEARRHPRREARVHHRSGDQVVTLHEIAEIHEQRGGALDLALAALARAWRIDVADDEALREAALARRQARRVGRSGRAPSRTAPHRSMASSPRRCGRRPPRSTRSSARDLKRAIDAWRKVDEARGDDPIALAALDRLLAVEGRVDELVKVVERRAEITEDAGVRLVLLHRVAALYEEVIEDKPRAIAAYKNVLGVDDTDLAALDALERLYRDTERCARDGRHRSSARSS